MVCEGTVASGESKRQSSTLSACSENSAKLTPAPSQVAPSGYERPGQTRIKYDLPGRRPNELGGMPPGRGLWIAWEMANGVPTAGRPLPTRRPRIRPVVG